MASFSETFARELGDILMLEKLAASGFFDALSGKERGAEESSAVGLTEADQVTAEGRGNEMQSKLAELYGTVPGITEKLEMLKQASEAGEVDLSGMSASELLEALEATPEEDDAFAKMAEEKKLAADTFGRLMAQEEFSALEEAGEVPEDWMPAGGHQKTASERIAALLG